MKMIKKIGIWIFALVMIVGLFGCSKNEERVEQNQQAENEGTVEEINTFDINNYPTMKEHMSEIEGLLKKAGIEGIFEYSFETFANDEKKYDSFELIFNGRLEVSVTFDENQEVKNIYLNDSHQSEISPSGEFMNAVLMLVDYSRLNLTDDQKTEITGLWADATTEGIQTSASTKNISVGDYKYTFMYLKEVSSTFVISINK